MAPSGLRNRTHVRGDRGHQFAVRARPLSQEQNARAAHTCRDRPRSFASVGRVQVRELHRGTIKAFLTDKRAGGLGKDSVRLIRAALSAMLSSAVDDAIIAANLALRLGLKLRGQPDRLTPAERQQTIRPMSAARLAALNDAADRVTPQYATLFLLLGHTGLRPGEALALRGTDIDFDARRLQVERAWSARRIESTKTGARRTVDLTDRLLRRLRRLQVERKAETLRRGWPQMPEWVFCPEAPAPRSMRAGSGRPSPRPLGPQAFRPTASTTFGTPSRACCWPAASRSPT